MKLFYRYKVCNDTILRCKFFSLQIRSLWLVPPMVVNLIKSDIVQKYDMSSLDHIVCAAAPLKLSIENEFKKKFRIKTVQQAYGLTESTMTIIIKRKDNHKMGTVGSTIPGTWTKVRPLCVAIRSSIKVSLIKKHSFFH